MVGMRGRNVDKPDRLPSAGPIDFGGIIQLGIHGGQGRKIDNAVPAAVPPDVGEHINRNKGRGGGQ